MGLDGNGIGLVVSAPDGEVEAGAGLVALAGDEVGHHLQAGAGTGAFIRVEFHVGKEIAAVLSVGVFGGLAAEGQVGADGVHPRLAVAHIVVLEALGVLDAEGQDAAARLIHQEGAHCIGVARHGHGCVQLAEVLAHQPLRDGGIAGDALHVGGGDIVALAVLHGGRGGVDVVGKGVVGGVVHLVGGGYVGSDERHHAGGRGHRQRQRGGNGDDRALAQGAMGLFIVLHGPLNLHQCVGGGVQGGEGLLEKLVFRHVCGTSDKMCFSFSLARASRVRTVSSGTSSRPAISFWR